MLEVKFIRAVNIFWMIKKKKSRIWLKIIIPEIQKVVYLFGDFRKPSNYVYDPKLFPKDYINLAGGLKESAYDEILIIDPDENEFKHNKN